MDVSIESLKPFSFHGVEFIDVPKDTKNPKAQARGVCPFCPGGKTKKFYVNCTTQLWDCKHCGRNGNLITFLEATLAAAVAATTKEHYRELGENRPGVPWKMFEEYGLGRDDLFASPRWLIPVLDLRGNLINLMVYQYGKPIMFTAGVPQTLWRLNQLRGAGPIIVAEGWSDAMAIERLRRAAKKKASVVAVPSASTFKTEWRELFQGRDSIWPFDNDTPGFNGCRSGSFKTQGYAKSIGLIQWPNSAAEGWDMRDFIHQGLDRDNTEPGELWDTFMSMIVPAETGNQGDIAAVRADDAKNYPKRKNFAAVVADFKKHYHLDERMEQALAIMFAVVLSTQLPGDPVWVFIVGPPGSGKTLLLRAFEKSPWCVYESSITAKSLVSGWRGESGGNSDPSLIPQLRGKCLILKDYTEVMTMSRESQEEMYGVLRGAYDGTVKRTYANGETRVYNDVYFTSLAGVTDRIHGDERASLGERFLKFQMVESKGYNPQSHILKALSGVKAEVAVSDLIRDITAGFTLKFDLTEKELPPLPDSFRTKLVALVQIIAFLRADVPRIGRDELAYEPVPEVGTRLAKQLKKLGQCLAVLFGKKTVDKECYKLMERVAMDTARGWSLSILRVIMRYHPQPTFAEVIEARCSIPKTTCARRLENLIAIGAVVRKKFKPGATPGDTGGPGQPPYGYAPSDELARLWKTAKIGEFEKEKTK